jgi:hypothetical protein
MKYKISAVLMLSLMLSMLFMPLAVAADDGKSIIKGMVQAPGDYSVGLITPSKYAIHELDRDLSPGYYMSRYNMYFPWAFLRLV